MNLATFIFASVPLLIQYFADKYRDDDYAKTLTELEAELAVPRIKTYDFIVVGAGTAGCVVAGRLSKKFNVLLLESGGDPVPETQVPSFSVGAHPAINYLYSTVPQPHAGQEWGGVFRPTFGRMLGGSGSHNGMCHNRGSPHDFDHWANLTGDPSWSYENVLQYFKRSEDFVGVLFDEGDEEAYGYGGPLKIDTQVNPLLPVWFAAARELGYSVGDPNAHQRESFTPYNVYIHQGRRVTTYTGYVRPRLRSKGNLTVVRYADVDQILLDGNKKAFGVSYTRHGIVQRAYASKEIVVSAGVVGSPLLLMKSGVGSADLLADAGIPMRVQLPGVGRNLMDHINVRVGPIYFNDSSLLSRIADGDEAAVLDRYHESSAGILAEIASGPQAFLVSSRAKEAGEGAWPDWRITIDQRPNGLAPATDGVESIFLAVNVIRPRNRGTICLNATAWRAGERDDTKLALIDYQLLTDASDVEVLVEGIKRTLEVFENTTAFQHVGARYPATPYSQCATHVYRSDEYWRCYILWKAADFYHMVGTNKMGAGASDPLAVVDTKLRVIGVEGLRVIDASIMPVITNANTNAPTIMIAEKGVDDILRQHGCLELDNSSLSNVEQ